MNFRTDLTPHGFEFRGTAREWFGIWIVNLVLTILTVGIYSAWAKVRARKYFAQNTYVGGRNFDYHATGLQILVGRIIFVAGIIAFSLFSTVPVIGLVLILTAIVLVPWLLVRALRFNAQMTSWSNVRFRFSGGIGGALLVYLIYPVLTALTLYLTVPFLTRAAKRYTMSNHALGAHAFSFDAPIGPFYRAFLVTIVWVLGVTLVIGALVWPALSGIDFRALESNPVAAATVVGAFYAWMFLALLPAATIYRAMIRNVSLTHLSLEGGHRFHSDVVPFSLVWIAVSNAIVTAVTLGLMLPWAQVRMARYLANHTALLAAGSLDAFVGQIEARATAVGDAYADIEGIELGLPV